MNRSLLDERLAMAEYLETNVISTCEVLDLYGLTEGEQENWHRKFRTACAMALSVQSQEAYAELGKVVAGMAEIGLREEV